MNFRTSNLFAMAKSLALVPAFLLIACAQNEEGARISEERPLVVEDRSPMTVEEAKNLAAELDSTRFSSAQPTIDDVKEKLARDHIVSANCTPNSDIVGRKPSRPHSQSKKDRSLASESTRLSAQMAFRYGNVPRALVLAQYAQDVLPANWLMDRGTAGMQVARYYAILGERKRAEQSYSASKAQFRKGKRESFSGYQLTKHAYEKEISATQGVMAFLEGRYREAELALRKEKMPLRVHEFAVDYNIVRYYFIWAIERQGRLDEAEAEARDFLALRGWSPTPEAALALESLARVMLSQGRYNDAEWLAKKAINIYGRLCVPDGMLFSSLAHLRLAQALLWQAKSQEALELFTMLENAAKTVGNKVYRNKILSNPGWGIALLATNRPDAAAQQLQVAAEILTEQFGPNSYQVIEAQSLQNLASMRTSQTCEGLDQQAASLGRLSDLRSVYGESGELSRIREARLAILLEGYLSLALSCSGE